MHDKGLCILGYPLTTASI